MAEPPWLWLQEEAFKHVGVMRNIDVQYGLRGWEDHVGHAPQWQVS